MKLLFIEYSEELILFYPLTMLTHLKSLFQNGNNNTADVRIICSDISFGVHSCVLIETSDYYETVVPSSIVYLQKYRSNVVKTLFEILYSENDSSFSNLTIEEGIHLFELIDLFMLKVNINASCVKLVGQLKERIGKYNYMDVLYLLSDSKNKYITMLRKYIFSLTSTDDYLINIVKSHMKNEKIYNEYKTLINSKHKPLPDYVTRKMFANSSLRVVNKLNNKKTFVHHRNEWRTPINKQLFK